MLEKIKDKLTISNIKKILPQVSGAVDTLPISELGNILNIKENFDVPKTFKETPLPSFKMEIHDAVILKYLYQNINPKIRTKKSFLVSFLGLS